MNKNVVCPYPTLIDKSTGAPPVGFDPVRQDNPNGELIINPKLTECCALRGGECAHHHQVNLLEMVARVVQKLG
jgi:hypothetical protein